MAHFRCSSDQYSAVKWPSALPGLPAKMAQRAGTPMAWAALANATP